MWISLCMNGVNQIQSVLSITRRVGEGKEVVLRIRTVRRGAGR
jgi:hypothetical protein